MPMPMFMSIIIVIINLSMSISVPIPIPMSMSIQISTSMVTCLPVQNKIASPRADKRPGGMREAIRIISEMINAVTATCCNSCCN